MASQAAIESADITECISVFFTNSFWIAIYKAAVDLQREDREGKYASLADAYRDAAGCHYRSLVTPADRHRDFMKITLQELYNFCKQPLQLDCTFIGFIDLCVKFILPPAHYQTATLEKKIIIFRTVLLKVLSKFANYVITRETDAIVGPGGREDKVAMTRCKEQFASIYRAERTHFYNQITAQASGLKTADASTTSRELVEKLQAEVHALLRERAYWQEECNKRNQFCMALKNLVLEKERMIEEMSKVQQVQRQAMKVQRNVGGIRPAPYVPVGYAPPPQPYYPPPPESVRTQADSKGMIRAVRPPRIDPNAPPPPPIVELDSSLTGDNPIDDFDPELEETLPADA